MLAIDGADAFVIALRRRLRREIGPRLGHLETPIAPRNGRARGDGAQAAIGAEQGDHAVGTDVDLLVVVAKEARRHREHQHPGELPVLVNGPGELDGPLLGYAPEHRLADVQTVLLGMVAVYTKVFPVAQVERCLDLGEIGEHQPALGIDHRHLGDDAAIRLLLFAKRLLERSLIQQVSPHVEQDHVHQPNHAAYMRLEGGREVHRILARDGLGQYAFMADFADDSGPHRHQCQQQQR